MAKSSSRREVAETETPQARGPARIVPAETPEIPTFYVNNTAIETSVWDVCLRLGETIQTDRENNILHVRSLARVRMSPQHAKVIVGILTQHLDNYERDFGKIPAPKTGTAPNRNDA